MKRIFIFMWSQRWEGDTNFLTVFGDVRSIPEHFKQTYTKLLPHFKKEGAHESL